jgi:hypothetical protein
VIGDDRDLLNHGNKLIDLHVFISQTANHDEMAFAAFSIPP